MYLFSVLLCDELSHVLHVDQRAYLVVKEQVEYPYLNRLELFFALRVRIRVFNLEQLWSPFIVRMVLAQLMCTHDVENTFKLVGLRF